MSLPRFRLAARADVSALSQILGRRRTGVCVKHQRLLQKAVKTARTMSVIPFTSRLDQFSTPGKSGSGPMPGNQNRKMPQRGSFQRR